MSQFSDLLFNIYRKKQKQESHVENMEVHVELNPMEPFWGDLGKTPSFLVKLCEILAHFPLSALFLYDNFFLLRIIKKLIHWFHWFSIFLFK